MGRGGRIWEGMVEDKKLHNTFRDPPHYQQTLPVDLYEPAMLSADYLQ
jgi:hypothetical protein